MKICKIFRNIISVSVASALFIIVSCAQFNVNEDRDSFVPGNVSDIMNRSALTEMAYMGGSVLYSPKNPSANQLAKDVVIAVRQGKVEKTYLGSGVYSYKNSEFDYNLGYIKVNSVSKENISFDYYEFYGDSASCRGSFSVDAGSTADLNNDGTPDIAWRKPDAGRKGIKTDMWLQFLCDMSKGDTTTMFSIVPEQYQGAAYPNGLIGINSDGRFVVSKYEVGGTSRTAVSAISYGDYVFDMQANTVARYVGENRDGRSAARAIDDCDLEVQQASFSKSNPEEYEFKPNEFANDFSITALLSKMPSTIIHEDFASRSIIENVEYLNRLIIEPDFINKLVAANSGDAVEEIKAQLNKRPVMPGLERVLFNRHSLALIYPEDCPDVNIMSSSLSVALPWFYVELGADEFDQLADDNSRAAFRAYNCSGELEAKYNSKVAKLRAAAEKKYADQHGVYEEGYIDYEIKRDVITGYFDTLKSVNLANFAAALSGQQWLADLIIGSDGQLRLGVDGNISFADGNPSINLKAGLLMKIEFQNRITMNVHSKSIFSKSKPEEESIDDLKKKFDEKFPDAKLNKDELQDWMDMVKEKDLAKEKGLNKALFKFEENGPSVTTDGSVRPSEDAKSFHKALNPVKTLPFQIDFEAKFDVLFDINAVVELNDVMVGGIFMNVFEVKAGINWGFREWWWKFPDVTTFYADTYAGGARFTESAGYIGFTKIDRGDARVGGGVQFCVTPILSGRLGVGLGYDIGVVEAGATIGIEFSTYAPIGLFVGLTFKPDWTPVFTTELGMDIGVSVYPNLKLSLDPPFMDERSWKKDIPGLTWNAVKPIFRIQQENGKLVKMEGPGEWEFSGLGC